MAAAETTKLKPNVLFVAVDDLKPLLGCYGDALAKTPHIDRLAARGTVFTRAYCMQAVCSPSRNSVMTGLRPEVLQIYDLPTHFRLRTPDVVTLPQHFKNNGWKSHGLGKIYHVGHGNIDDAQTWSVPHFQPRGGAYVLPENTVKKKPQPPKPKSQMGRGPKDGPAFEAADVPDNAYADGKIAAKAIDRLRSFKSSNEPFFLAVGFLKPHLPFNAPQIYWDMHDPSKLPLADRDSPPDGAPPFAPQSGGELRNYVGIPKSGPLPADLQRKLIHGYYAATSYMDAQVGRILDELDALGLSENTIIVLWGDHGWHLGDHGIWCKHTNYEQATRSPLIMAAPGKSGGQKSAALTEFVDIYPTLCDLANLPKPTHLRGDSFVTVLDKPDTSIKDAAFQVYPRHTKDTGPLLGHAVRTESWRYVEWRRTKDQSVVATELYDMQNDPGETRNLANEPAQAKTIANHRSLLEKRLAIPAPSDLKLLPLK
ncbi:sulfatase [Phragmitibacter flavus]|uniref:Sulfatase n=1 Tax=Phragmitibacter flavus TaxID=2576071 RepID=A0A5R8K9Z8_9BACT|nr:sulfatase [Phragmitibacter flavus]TLD69116.1 sulfatase [Phragmitibacter flavus]